jgi:uncharacterized protein (DUF1501 family)
MYSRRSILRLSGLGGISAALKPYSRFICDAQTTSGNDYKAIVCIFLFGGNDSNNMLIPTDPVAYGAYTLARGPLAIPQSQLLQLTGQSYAVHPSMPEVQSLFAAQQLAFVANVGTLVAPVTMNEYLGGSVILPQNLMSHPDQQQISQTAAEASDIQIGWGGGIADAVSGLTPSSQLPTAVSYFGSAAFIRGNSSNGLISPGSGGFLACSEHGACTAIETAVNEMLACPESVARVQAEQGVLKQLLSLDSIYSTAVKQAQPFKTQLPANANGNYSQFTGMAQLMQVRNIIGSQRQILFGGIGSFDTHQNQNQFHGNLLQTLSGSLNYFMSLLEEMNLLDNVVILTMSDFNRTLQANAGAGTDHAWGGHQIVAGGPVQGGKIYGTFPNLILGGPDDITAQGRWLPTTSISQVGATVASWFGVPDTALATIFPGIGNFPSPKLSFI